MPEQQIQPKCQHCGYPVEIGEHAPGCPNRKESPSDSAKAEQSIEVAEKNKEAFFTELGLTMPDAMKSSERPEGEKRHPALETVDQRSPENIRSSVDLFLKYYTERGIRDWKTHKAREESRRTELRQQRGYGPDESIPWQISREVNEQVFQEIGTAQEVRFQKAEVQQAILNELERVRGNASIAYNVDFDSLEKILKSGTVVPMTELPTDQQAGHRKTGGVIGMIGGADPEGYSQRRLESEQAMGIHEEQGPKPVYAALAGGSTDAVEWGAAPQYGEFVLVLEESRIANRTVFTEGDSMNPMGLIDPLRGKAKLSEHNGIEHRQLNRRDAEAALALYNVSEQLERPYRYEDPTVHNLARDVQYIEAQVLGGVSLNDIKEIKINDWELASDLERYRKQYPQYADKFVLAKHR